MSEIDRLHKALDAMRIAYEDQQYQIRDLRGRLDTAQAAERLGLSRRQVQHLIKQGTLPATKFGRDHQIRPEDVEALLPRPPRGWPAGRPRAKETER